MKEEIKIRQGIVDDTKELVQFMLEMAFETEHLELDETVLFKGIQNCLRDPKKGCYYIAEIEHKAVACLMTTFEWSDWRNTWVIWIQSVYVKPENRRKGIYKKMYEHINDICNNNIEYAGIRLYVDKTNHSAIKTYADLGMNGNHYQVFEKMKS